MCIRDRVKRRGLRRTWFDVEQRQETEVLLHIVDALHRGNTLTDELERVNVANGIPVEDRALCAAGQRQQRVLPAIGGKGNEVHIRMTLARLGDVALDPSEA